MDGLVACKGNACYSLLLRVLHTYPQTPTEDISNTRNIRICGTSLTIPHEALCSSQMTMRGLNRLWSPKTDYWLSGPSVSRHIWVPLAVRFKVFVLTVWQQWEKEWQGRLPTRVSSMSDESITFMTGSRGHIHYCRHFQALEISNLMVAHFKVWRFFTCDDHASFFCSK